jgi:vancomycin resistance protein VanJ
MLVLYAVAILTWLLARAIWGDGAVLLAAINSFPAAPFVFVPGALVLAALDRRPVAVIAALIPAALWLVLFGWRFLPRAGSVEAGDGVLRVMAFNVLYVNQDIEAIAGAIMSSEPDIIALPELTLAQDPALAQRVGAQYPYRILSRLPGSGFGTGIYSRWPLVDRGSLQTGLGLRSAVADVETPDGAIRFVAVHPRATLAAGSSLRDIAAGMRQSFRGREAQLTAICSHVAGWGDIPVLLAGDFNLSEFSDAYRCLGRQFGDAYKQVGRGYGATWPHGPAAPGWPLRWVIQTRIDYVFHSHHWRPVYAEVLDAATGSDHKVVVTTLMRQ